MRFSCQPSADIFRGLEGRKDEDKSGPRPFGRQMMSVYLFLGGWEVYLYYLAAEFKCITGGAFFS